ncbi:MAG: hypothetical protein LBB91_06525 [Clostridiales bacterium]|jgi:hypothetical protein|nr:hypothetical protein [Clostridiales bacterium]
MNSNIAIDFRNPTLIRKAGMSALKKELGAVGATYFIRQFSAGRGNYTAERDKLLEGITLDEIIKNVKKIDAQQA